MIQKQRTAKLLILVFMILVVSPLVLGKDIAYIVKDTGSPNDVFVSIIQQQGYSYDIIDDSEIPSTDFSGYKMILVGNEPISNYRDLPITTKNSFVANKYYVDVWKIARYTSTLSLGNGYVKGVFIYNNSINYGLQSPVQLYNAYSKPVYYIPRLPNRALDMKRVVGTYNVDANPLIGIIYPGGRLYRGGNAGGRILYFGMTETNYWTEGTRKLFKNSLFWVLYGEDADNDGYYYDTDCNDLNASIYPGAEENPYNYVDENCDGYDIADLDEDGFCKEDYLISDKLLQCSNEPSDIGTDCNEEDNEINLNAVELTDDIDQNCINDQPIFNGNVPDIEWSEDSIVENAVELRDYFVDPDGDELMYWVYNTSSNTNILIDTEKLINGTITLESINDWNGEDWIEFFGIDERYGYTVTNRVALIVNAVNDAPVLPSGATQYFVGGENAVIEIEAEDVDGDVLTYTLSGSISDKFSGGNPWAWQTTEEDVGEYSLTAGVNDGQASDSVEFALVVLPKIVINEFESSSSSGMEWIELYNPSDFDVNISGWEVWDKMPTSVRRHVFSNDIIESKSYFIFNVNGLTNEGESLVLKKGETIIDETPILSDTLEDSKTWQRVPNGIDSDSQEDWMFQQETKGINNEEDVLEPQVELIIPENNSFFNVDRVDFRYSVSDDKAVTLSCTLYSDINGSYMALATQNIENGSIGNFYADDIDDGSYKWDVRCYDGRNYGYEEKRTFVIDEPDAPVLVLQHPATINETETAVINVTSSYDADGDSLTFYIDDERFLQSEQGLFVWNTGFSDSGIYNATITASDGMLNTSMQVIIIVLNKNREPVFIGEIPGQLLNEDESVQIDLSSYFFDEDNDNLTFKAQGNSSIKFDFSDGTAIIIPNPNWNGFEQVKIVASDLEASAESNVFDIIVNPLNDPPVIQPINNITVYETENATINVNAIDVDGDGLLYWISDLSRFNQDGNIFTWQTNYTDSGEYDFEVRVNDGLLSDSKIVKVSVLNKNEPPHFIPIENISIMEDSGFSDVYALQAYDNDGNITRFEVSQEDTNKVDCSINAEHLGATPAKDFFGLATCKIRVYDNENGFSETLAYINVTNVNDAPVIVSQLPNFNPLIAENGMQNFNITFHDIDSNNVLLKWYLNNELKMTGNNFVFGASRAGNYEIRVIVNDSELESSYTWNVVASNIPIASEYDGETTQFSGLTDFELANINLILEKIGSGKIEFLDSLDLRNTVDFNHYSFIMRKLAGIDSSYLSALKGKSARLTFYGLNFSKTPTVYYSQEYTKNESFIDSMNTVCPSNVCSNVSYNNAAGTLTFLTNSFSVFKIGDVLSCSGNHGSICSSSEYCSGSIVESIEDNCCAGTCIEIPPKFDDVDEKCENLSSSILLVIKEPEKNENFKVKETLKTKVELRNNGDDQDFDLDVYLYDITEEDVIAEKKGNLEIDSGKKKTENFEFEIPRDVDDSNNFAIFVKAEDDDCQESYVKIKLDRESHDLDVDSVRIEPESAVCGEFVNVEVKLKNVGDKDEKDVSLTIENKELGIRERWDIEEIERFGEDDDYSSRFTIQIPEDAKAGEYELVARALFGDEEEKKDATIKVSECKPEEVSSEEVGKISLNEASEKVVSRSPITIIAVITIVLVIVLIILSVKAAGMKKRSEE